MGGVRWKRKKHISICVAVLNCCFKTSRNKSEIIHSDLMPSAMEVVGDHSEKYSVEWRSLGWIKIGGRDIPMALTIPTNVTNTPRSSENIWPTCFFPFVETILTDLITGVIFMLFHDRNILINKFVKNRFIESDRVDAFRLT